MPQVLHLTSQPPAVSQLLEMLSVGREAAFETHARSLMHAVARALKIEVIPSVVRGRTQHCVFSRPDLAFRGFGREDLHGMVVGSAGDSWLSPESSFLSRIESLVEMPFIFTTDNETCNFVRQRVGEHLALVFSPDEVRSLISAPKPLNFLKQLIIARFGLGALHPFDHHHPISDGSFLGRRDVLQRLRDNPRTNFALVGPSKIGKTSLVQRYLRPCSSNQSLRLRQFYVDLYTLPPTDHAFARALRMAVDPSASAYYDEPENLGKFLEKVRSRLGTLELVLDETDKHCHLETMRKLIHLTQRDVCRLILVGRWRLMKEAVHTRDDNFSRLEPLVLEPFTLDEAVSLLERPLTDLGLKPGSVRHELRTVINRLGRVPGYIQEFGCMLIEEIAGNSPEITSDHIRRALARVITTSRLVGLLDDLSSSIARAAALIMAMCPPPGGETDPLWLREEFARREVHLRARDCMEVCDELVIHHLLGYQEGVYRVVRWDFVAEGQVERRRFLAVLEDELTEVRRQQTFQ